MASVAPWQRSGQGAAKEEVATGRLRGEQQFQAPMDLWGEMICPLTHSLTWLAARSLERRLPMEPQAVPVCRQSNKEEARQLRFSNLRVSLFSVGPLLLQRAGPK